MEYRDLLIFFVFVSVTALALVIALAEARGNESKLQAEKDKILQDKAAQALLLSQAHEDSAAWRKKLDEASLTILAKEKQLEMSVQQAKQLHMELGITKQLCAEMPITKQRVLDLERALAVEQDRFGRFLAKSERGTAQIEPTPAIEEPLVESLVPELENESESIIDDEDLPPLPLLAADAPEAMIGSTSSVIDDTIIKTLKQENQLLLFKNNELKKKLIAKKA